MGSLGRGTSQDGSGQGTAFILSPSPSSQAISFLSTSQLLGGKQPSSSRPLCQDASSLERGHG